MRSNSLALLPALAACLVASFPSPAQVVRKVVDRFDTPAWRAGGYNRASGHVGITEADAAPGAPAVTCLVVKARYSGKGFEFFSAEPVEPLTVPGEARCIRLRVRRSNAAYGLSLGMRDGWNREKGSAGEHKIDIPFRAGAGAWETVELRIPPAWVKPVRLAAFSTHNWGHQDRAAEAVFHIDDLEVETDLSNVDRTNGVLRTWQPDPKPGKETPASVWAAALRDVRIISSEQSNVFSREEPVLTAHGRNWLVEPMKGSVRLVVVDDAGQPVSGAELARPFEVPDVAALRLPLNVPRFGRFHADATVQLDDGRTHTERITFARIPPWRDLPERVKDRSPYGVNVHGGGTPLPFVPFRKAGLVWFRDYAFGHDVMIKANEDRQWGGWPWYPRLLRQYEELGLRVLPCSQGSIPKLPDDTAVRSVMPADKPPRNWTRAVADRLISFPDLRYWELDNEYDLHGRTAQAETAAGWPRYRAYHKAFGQLLRVFGGEAMKAVENGRAGVWPDRLKACIDSGDFADIDVVNVHHYTGIEPPEVNVGNMNTGFAEDHSRQDPGLFFDRLRDVKAVAQSDGRTREAFLTEFGWDTLAGHVVTPEEQAAYLVRGYLLAMAAGMDKAFWFFHYDSPAPHNFFDGCGLLGPVEHGGPPKRALCSLAGLTWLLPNPAVIGQVNAGPNTGGYVLEQDGRLTAVLFAIRGNDGPEVTVAAKQLYDLFANPLPGTTVKLGRDPVYAVDLARSDPLYLQTAYEIGSHHLVLATAGDEVTGRLSVRNNRGAPLAGTLDLDVPAGWLAGGPAEFSVAADGRCDLPFRFTVSGGEALGERSVALRVQEQGRIVKTLPLRVLVQEALAMQVGPITGRPGATSVEVKLLNRTARPLGGSLKLHLPASWQAPQFEIAVAALAAGERRAVPVPFTWQADWRPGERAGIAFVPAGDGVDVARPLIPNTCRIPRVDAVVCDGDLADWPAESLLPPWMMGSDLGSAGVEVRLAWSPAGLHLAARVTDASLVTTDPRSFWDGDCLELFLDTADNKRQRGYEPGDHQFWFVPLVDAGRVYVGQWKRGQELDATRYDITGIASAARREGDGYVLEVTLPAASMVKYEPAAGGRLGLCVNLTVHGRSFTRQVYWPWTKDWAVQNWPRTWGSVELGE